MSEHWETLGWRKDKLKGCYVKDNKCLWESGYFVNVYDDNTKYIEEWTVADINSKDRNLINHRSYNTIEDAFLDAKSIG